MQIAHDILKKREARNDDVSTRREVIRHGIL
nr:MAG TPA: hypothetical protein [Caudoviricetes sp.]